MLWPDWMKGVGIRFATVCALLFTLVNSVSADSPTNSALVDDSNLCKRCFKDIEGMKPIAPTSGECLTLCWHLVKGLGVPISDLEHGVPDLSSPSDTNQPKTAVLKVIISPANERLEGALEWILTNEPSVLAVEFIASGANTTAHAVLSDNSASTVTHAIAVVEKFIQRNESSSTVIIAPICESSSLFGCMPIGVRAVSRP